MVANTDNTTIAMVTSTDDTNQKLDDFVFYSEAYVQTGILLIGLLFNTCNYIVLRRTQMAVTFRTCLLAMSLTDAFACLFGAVQLVVESVYFRGHIPFGYWHGSALASHLLYYLFLMFLCASSFYVILASAVRAYMIAKPYKAAERLKVRKIKKMCVVIVVVVAILFTPSPLYAVWQVCYAEDNYTPACVDYFIKLPKVEYMKFYFYGLSLLFGPGVIVANISCLIVIHRALKKSHERTERMTRKEEKKEKHYRRITNMLLVILILDTLWLVPTCVQYLGLVFSPENTVFNSTDAGFVIFDIVAEILLLFRPTYNIFVYLSTNIEYRRTFRRKLCKCMPADDSTESTVDFDNSTSKNNQLKKDAASHDVRDNEENMRRESLSESVVKEQDIYILPCKPNDF